MASVQDLRRRIRSVRNTRKITKAFELVASARLRRAQARIEAMRPYADRMLELMIGTARAATSVHGLPLLQRRRRRKINLGPAVAVSGLLHAIGGGGVVLQAWDFVGGYGHRGSGIGHFDFLVHLLLLRRPVVYDELIGGGYRRGGLDGDVRPGKSTLGC